VVLARPSDLIVLKVSEDVMRLVDGRNIIQGTIKGLYKLLVEDHRVDDIPSAITGLTNKILPNRAISPRIIPLVLLA
jgi:hypothetical protein